MTKEAFDKIAGGLKDAQAYADGDGSKGRVATLPAEYEKVTIRQMRGPKVAFTGKLFANADWQTSGHNPMDHAFELWETPKGNWIAVTSFKPLGADDSLEDNSVLVIEPSDDEQARRFAAMAHWEWHNRAREMVRKQLGWSLKMEIE